jgi:hypothetical protein
LNTPPVFWPSLLFVQAEAHGRAGNPEQGLSSLDQALELIGRDSKDIEAVEFFRLKGDLLLALSPDRAPEAEPWFHQALEVARMHQLSMPELRAAASLSRLWRDQGRIEEGRQLLSEAYARFTEGFTTVDLREAKDLLSSL